MNNPEVLTERSGHVVRVVLNRPERLNAVSEIMYLQLIDALDAAEADPDVRCVILSGAGRAFCVGADLKEHRRGQRDDTAKARYIQFGQDAAARIQTVRVPVVAAVNGYAVGAGAEMAVAADFLVISAQARLRFPEASIGTFVGGGVSQRLPRLVGVRRATQLLVLGDWFTGTDALSWGLADEAPAEEDFSARVNDLAQQIATKAPLSVAALKKCLFANATLETALRTEADNLLRVMDTEDWAEGIAAFAEKRSPSFLGR
jgi:enoyl-CoA hydratase